MTTTFAPAPRSSQAHARPATPAPPAPTRALTGRPARLPSSLPVRELLFFLLDALPEDRVQRQLRRVPARRNDPAQTLGHRADMVGGPAAADADVAHTEVARRGSKIGQFEARTEERIEGEREHSRAGSISQGLERRLVGRRPVRHGLRDHSAAHRSPDLRDQRQYRLRPPRAVEADDIRPRRLQPLTRLVERVAVDRRVARRGEAHKGREAELLDHLEADQRLAEVVVGLGDDEVRSLLRRPGDLLAVHLADELARALRSVRIEDPRVANVACDERVALCRHLYRQAERVPVERLQVLLPPDLSELLPVPVVGEGHHHLRPRAQELAMALTNPPGKVR